MNYSEQFANGYANFALMFLLSAVIGFVFYVVKNIRQELKEKEDAKNEKTTAIVNNIYKKVGHLSVEYNEKFDTYYVFNTETGAFVTQNQNPLELLENIRDTYVSYDMNAKDENTARTMVERVRELQEKRNLGV